MVKFELDGGVPSEPEKIAKVKVEIDSKGKLNLLINGYYVFEISKEGFGRLTGSVPSEYTGLVTDRQGKIVLKEII